MSTNSFAHRRRSLPRVVLCVVLAAACDSTAVPTSPVPTSPSRSPVPAPTPESTQYRVSGIVMDAANAAPIANATVALRHNKGELTTRTDADGAYAFSFDTSGPYPSPSQIVPGDFVGLLSARDGAYWGDTGRGHSTTVQLLPWGNAGHGPERAPASGEDVGSWSVDGPVG